MKSKNALGYAVVPAHVWSKTLEDQMSEINVYAKKNNITIAGWVIGSSKDKSELKNLINGVDGRMSDVGMLIATEVKVIASDYRELFYYNIAFNKIGVGLNFISIEDFDLTSYNIIQGLTSYIEQQDMFNNPVVVYNKYNKAMDVYTAGRGHVGPPTYGYARTVNKLIINKEESEVVQLVFSERDKGATLREIKKLLEDKKYKTRNNKFFATGTISLIVNNRKIYEGYIQNKLGEWVKGNHPAILEEV
jgi:hypothetical protein